MGKGGPVWEFLTEGHAQLLASCRVIHSGSEITDKGSKGCEKKEAVPKGWKYETCMFLKYRGNNLSRDGWPWRIDIGSLQISRAANQQDKCDTTRVC